MTRRVGANKAVFLAPKAAFHSLQGKQLMGLPLGIADHKHRTGTFTVTQVDDEEKSPIRFGNPGFRPTELTAQHFAGLHQVHPLQYSNINLSVWICFGRDRWVSRRYCSSFETIDNATKCRDHHSAGVSMRCVIAALAASSRCDDLRRRSRACARLSCSRRTMPDPIKFRACSISSSPFQPACVGVPLRVLDRRYR